MKTGLSHSSPTDNASASFHLVSNQSINPPVTLRALAQDRDAWDLDEHFPFESEDTDGLDDLASQL